MERWTITERLADRFRLSINFGGRAFWCMFDYIASADPEVDGIEVLTSATVDSDTAEWFPHIKRGMEEGREQLKKHYGRLLTGVRIEVTKIHTHPIDTTVHGCERYGSEFIVQLGRNHAVRLPE